MNEKDKLKYQYEEPPSWDENDDIIWPKGKTEKKAPLNDYKTIAENVKKNQI